MQIISSIVFPDLGLGPDLVVTGVCLF